MTTGWGAPRTAYHYSACVAEQDAAAADAIWKELDYAGRADMVLVIGAQCRRTASWLLPGASGQVGIAQFFDLMGAMHGQCCGPVSAYATQALYGRGVAPRRPRCECREECLRAAADAMIEIGLATAAAAGFSRKHVAVICRHAAS